MFLLMNHTNYSAGPPFFSCYWINFTICKLTFSDQLPAHLAGLFTPPVRPVSENKSSQPPQYDLQQPSTSMSSSSSSISSSSSSSLSSSSMTSSSSFASSASNAGDLQLVRNAETSGKWNCWVFSWKIFQRRIFCLFVHLGRLLMTALHLKRKRPTTHHESTEEDMNSYLMEENHIDEGHKSAERQVIGVAWEIENTEGVEDEDFDDMEKEIEEEVQRLEAEEDMGADGPEITEIEASSPSAPTSPSNKKKLTRAPRKSRKAKPSSSSKKSSTSVSSALASQSTFESSESGNDFVIIVMM